jgi:hypothetical protein
MKEEKILGRRWQDDNSISDTSIKTKRARATIDSKLILFIFPEFTRLQNKTNFLTELKFRKWQQIYKQYFNFFFNAFCHKICIQKLRSKH